MVERSDHREREGGQVQLQSHRTGEEAIVARAQNPNTQQDCPVELPAVVEIVNISAVQQGRH